MNLQLWNSTRRLLVVVCAASRPERRQYLFLHLRLERAGSWLGVVGLVVLFDDDVRNERAENQTSEKYAPGFGPPD